MMSVSTKGTPRPLTTADMLLAGSVIAYILFSFLAEVGSEMEKGEKVMILSGGVQAKIRSLSDQGVQEYAGPIGSTMIEIGDPGVRIKSSPCPRQICVATGWIRRQGELSVCLPNRIILQIVGSAPPAFDGVTR